MAPSPVRRRALASLLAGAVATGLGIGAFGGAASAVPRPNLNQVQRQVDALNHQAEQAAERYNTARVELGDTTRRLRAVRHRFERQQKAFAEMRTLVGDLAAATYKSGNVDLGVALIFSDDATTFLRQAAGLEQLGQQQSTMLRRMATVRLRLRQDRMALRQQQAMAADLQADLAQEKRSVEGKLEHAERLLDSLEAGQRASLENQRRAAQNRAIEARDGATRASRDSHVDTPGDDASPADTGGDADTDSEDGDSGDGDSGDGDSGDGDSGDDGPASGRAAQAVRTAYAQLGDPYAWGADGPSSFDCSGLTMYSWAAAGVSLPHSSSAQYSAVRHIAVSDLEPGDLVFYYSPISHVAVYIGGGRVIDAPYPGLSVHITGLYSMPLVGAGRP
jgi:peptidoglycan DL-endopeptidase CwlO